MTQEQELRPIPALTKVMIAIQARSTSTRFPQKIFQTVGKRTVLQMVIDAALSAKHHIERPSNKWKIKCDVAVLIPEKDDQLFTYLMNSKMYKNSCDHIIIGDEQNVFSRFFKLYHDYNPDYIVRLTSDCPLIQDIIISKHINVAVINNYDYVSNVDEKCRLIADGFDCEIMSKKAIEWLVDHNITDEDKEHVTTALRRTKPTSLKLATVISRMDTSKTKMSLDTLDDLIKIRQYHHDMEFKKLEAHRLYGKRNVFEL